MATKTWLVQVTLDEEGDDTRADATLQLENKMEMRGRGFSRRRCLPRPSQSALDYLSANAGQIVHQL